MQFLEDYDKKGDLPSLPLSHSGSGKSIPVPENQFRFRKINSGSGKSIPVPENQFRFRKSVSGSGSGTGYTGSLSPGNFFKLRERERERERIPGTGSGTGSGTGISEGVIQR